MNKTNNQFQDKLRKHLAFRSPKLMNEADYFQAAVVVPLIQKEGKLGVLFEVRSPHLAWQPSEICFPGGRIEASDPSPEAAAVRETAEELNLSSEYIKILGPLDYIVSAIGVIVYPFAGYIMDEEKIKPSRDEVAEVFVVPLEYLLANEPQYGIMDVGTKPVEGFPLELLPDKYPQDWRRRGAYPVLFYRYKEYVIWGLTARLLSDFIEVCRQTGVPKL